MRIVNSRYGLDIQFQETRIECLVVENICSYRNIINELIAQSDGDDGDFVLSEKDKILKMGKQIELVLNPFIISLNSKKILNALYSNLSTYATDLFEEKGTLCSTAISFIEKLIIQEQYAGILYDFDFDVSNLLKLFNVRISEEYESLVEKIVEYIKVVSGLSAANIICFVGLKDYVSQDELRAIEKQAIDSKVYLLLLENAEKTVTEFENCYIIDKDNCLIFRQFGNA